MSSELDRRTGGGKSVGVNVAMTGSSPGQLPVLALALHDSVGMSGVRMTKAPLDQEKLGLLRIKWIQTERYFRGAGYNHPTEGHGDCRRDGSRVARPDSAVGRTEPFPTWPADLPMRGV